MNLEEMLILKAQDLTYSMYDSPIELKVLNGQVKKNSCLPIIQGKLMY